MLGPSRPLPRVGAAARIKHFGGGSEHGTVVAIYEDGRRLQVRGEDGEPHEFVLNPANARFVSSDSAQGPLLELVGERLVELLFESDALALDDPDTMDGAWR